jgi:hypothetical protein
VLVASADGLRELERNGVLASIGRETSVIADETIELPPLPVEPLRLPLREAGPKRAALAAVAAWVEHTGVLPTEALRPAIGARLGTDAQLRTRGHNALRRAAKELLDLPAILKRVFRTAQRRIIAPVGSISEGESEGGDEWLSTCPVSAISRGSGPI